MGRNSIFARLFAWLVTIFILILIFLGGQWIFNTLAVPVVEFIFEMEGFIRVFEIILFILFILFLLFFGSFLIQWITELFNEGKVPQWVAYIGSVLILLLFIYVAFAPYFYTSAYLEKIGTERIHDLAVLTDEELTKEERLIHAKKTLTMGEVRQEVTERTGFPLENRVIRSIESIEIERSYNTYTYTAEIELESRQGREVSTWILDIKPGFFTFLVEGYERH